MKYWFFAPGTWNVERCAWNDLYYRLISTCFVPDVWYFVRGYGWCFGTWCLEVSILYLVLDAFHFVLGLLLVLRTWFMEPGTLLLEHFIHRLLSTFFDTLYMVYVDAFGTWCLALGILYFVPHAFHFVLGWLLVT